MLLELLVDGVGSKYTAMDFLSYWICFENYNVQTTPSPKGYREGVADFSILTNEGIKEFHVALKEVGT
jgi:hypothetical protein